MPEKLKAISLRQPWAEEILMGIKRVEFRGSPTKHRGPIYIYASMGRVEAEQEAEWEREHGISVNGLPRGVVIGTVEIVGCKKDDNCFAWQLANPKRLQKPMPPVEKAQPVWFHPFGKPER